MTQFSGLAVAAPLQRLTAYEESQVAAIAAWKARSPSLGQRAVRLVSRPIGEVVDDLLPKTAVFAVIEAVNKMAGQLAQDDNILKDAYLQSQGVGSSADLAVKPLEFADTLAGRVVGDAGRIALGMGAATGAGGLVTAAAGMPVLLAGALRVIHRVSQAYGYVGDPPKDRMLMLHILALSTAIDPKERELALVNYQRQIEASFIRQAVEESTQKVLQRALLGAELGSLIPGFGIAFNAYLNRAFIDRAGLTAQRVFQEYWLRERGKVKWILPGRGFVR